jgi:dienelactone hydrolase
MHAAIALVGVMCIAAGCAGTTTTPDGAPAGVTSARGSGGSSHRADSSSHGSASDARLDDIPIRVSRPDGPGPFPAVVIMHDCSGLGAGSSGAPARWTKELVERGYVVIVPDSFTTRGYPGGVCTEASRSRGDVSPSRRVADAYAALARARAHADVDGSRVGIMGGSHGGSTVLATIATTSENQALARDGAGFVAAVALYPRCQPYAWGYKPIAPLLILIGDKDDWTPAEQCRTLAEAARSAGQPVTLKIYPGAHHSFDNDKPVRYVPTRINPSVAGGRGATTGGNPEAWADSIREVTAFFGQHLARRLP